MNYALAGVSSVSRPPVSPARATNQSYFHTEPSSLLSDAAAYENIDYLQVKTQSLPNYPFVRKCSDVNSE